MKVKGLIIPIISLFIAPFILVNKIQAGNYPFPINMNFPNASCIRITSYNASDILAKYNVWKSAYVTAAGAPAGMRRVQSPEPIYYSGTPYTNATVSEGIAYGMLLAVYFDDQALFDDLWEYKVNKTGSKTSGLMPWIINSGGTVLDTNSASDADFDIAFALLMADKQWGSGGTFNYLSLGTAEIVKCRQYDISSADYHVKPGDGWDDREYPSYYFPAFFREFALVDSANATLWNGAIAKCLANINANRNATSGLVGEVCNHDGSRINTNPCGTAGCDGRLYKYNSCRVPFRYATDWAWNGAVASSSGPEVSLLASFFTAQSAAGVRDGYWISNNTVEGPYNNASFVGPAGCAMVYSSTYTTSLSNYYSRTSAFNANESYYNGSLQLLSLLFMTGNFQNLRAIGPPQPTATFTPIPNGQIIDSFEDYSPTYNTQNDWGGYWYTIASDGGLAASCSVVNPTEGGFVTMTAGGAFAGSNWHLRITGSKCAAVPPSNYPSIGFGTELRQNARALGLSVDLRPFAAAGGGIRFFVKGDGVTAYKVSLNPMGTGTTIHTDWAVYQYVFIPPATWQPTQYAIPFANFTQPAWSTETYTLDAVLAIMQQINWQNGDDTAITVDLAVDQVELYPYLWTPTPNPTMTHTRTQTRTATLTVTPTFGPSELLDDCEDNNSVNNWGGFWYTYNDSANAGTSYIVPVPGAGFTMYGPAQGAAGTQYAARVTGYVTDAYEGGYEFGFVGLGTGTNINSGTGVGINVNTALGLRFWAKGNDAYYNLQLVPGTTTVDGGNHYKKSFFASSTWTQYQIFFSDMTQEVGWGTAVALNLVKSNLAAFHWQTIGQPWANMELIIDQVEVFPMMAWTRTYTPSPTRTVTPTATRSNTISPTFTRTNTPVPNTPTFTRTATGTFTRTVTGTFTRTATPTNTNTPLPTNTNTPTRTNTPPNTFTFTSTNTPYLSPTHTRTVTNTNSPTFTRTVTNTGTYTATPLPTSTFTSTRTGTPTFTRTPTPTYTRTATPSRTPTFTATPSPTFTVTPTNTPSPTISNTWTPGFGTMTNSPTITQTWTYSASPTRTATPSFTTTFTRTPTLTFTATGTGTFTRTYTATFTITVSPTVSNTPQGSPTNTPPNTATHTRTVTSTFTSIPTGTFTRTGTPSFTRTMTNTPSPTVSNTWTPGFGTQTNTPVVTQTWTSSASPTRTNTQVNTPTNTATVVSSATNTPAGTSTPTGTPGSPCSYTFGKTAIGASQVDNAGYLDVNKYTLTECGTVQTLSIYIAATTGGSVRMALYSDVAGVPGSLLAESAAVVVTTGWNVIDIPDTLLAAGDYWIGLQSQTGVQVVYDNGVNGDDPWINYTFGAFPPVLPAMNPWNALYSMYASYCLGPCPSPTNTHTVSPTITVSPTASVTPTYVGTCACPDIMGKSYDAIGGVNIAGWMAMNWYGMSEDGNAQAMSVRVISGTGNMRVALYTDVANVPGVKISESASTAVTAGWNTIPIGQVFLQAGSRYWLALQMDDPSLIVGRDTGGSPGDEAYVAFGYGAFPGNAPAMGSSNGNWDIQVNYCPIVCGTTPTYTPTNTPIVTATDTPAGTLTNTPVVTATGTPSYTATVVIPTFTRTVTVTYTPTFTMTFTVTVTNTFTRTPTPTFTATPTVTNTTVPTFTFTSTPTVTLTATVTPDTQAINDIIPYPNPVDPAGRPEIYIGFRLNQKDCDRLGFRIYTASYRLIREMVYEGAAKDLIVNNGRIRYTTDNLTGLSNGTYFYFMYVVKNGVETRSKIDKIVILKQ